MQQIGHKQMSIFVLLFIVGSTPLFVFGINAKQDAWLAMTVAAAAVFLLAAMYIRLQKRAPEAGMAELCKIHFGKWAGGAAALLYAGWFAYESMLSVRNGGELMSMTLLVLTPKWIITLLIWSLAVYTASKGVEVSFRVIQLIFPIVVIGYSIIIVLLFVAGLPDLRQLQPVLVNGVGPVVREAFPNLLSFPFGQLIIILVFWSHVAEKNIKGRTIYWPLAGASLFLIFMNIIVMSVLGVGISSMSKVPLLEAVQLIRLADFIERLDIFVTLLILCAMYIKITAMYMAAVYTFSAVTGLAYRLCFLPIGVLIYAASFFLPNYTTYIWIGFESVYKFVPIIQIVIPLLMLVAGVRKKYKLS